MPAPRRRSPTAPPNWLRNQPLPGARWSAASEPAPVWAGPGERVPSAHRAALPGPCGARTSRGRSRPRNLMSGGPGRGRPVGLVRPERGPARRAPADPPPTFPTTARLPTSPGQADARRTSLQATPLRASANPNVTRVPRRKRTPVRSPVTSHPRGHDADPGPRRHAWPRCTASRIRGLARGRSRHMGGAIDALATPPFSTEKRFALVRLPGRWLLDRRNH